MLVPHQRYFIEEEDAMSLAELVKSVNAAAASGPSDVTEEERMQLLQACDRLRSSLETPFETTLRIIFSVFYPMPSAARASRTDADAWLRVIKQWHSD